MSTTDPRQFRADSILSQAGQWLKVRTKDGRPLAFGVPSTREPNRVYLTTPRACTCPDFERRGGPCKHMHAVRAYCQRRRAEKEARPTAESYAF